MKKETTNYKVVVSNPDHPHYGESGQFTGKIVELFGKPMAEVKLDNCEHGSEACFISKGDVTAI